MNNMPKIYDKHIVMLLYVKNAGTKCFQSRQKKYEHFCMHAKADEKIYCAFQFYVVSQRKSWFDQVNFCVSAKLSIKLFAIQKKFEKMTSCRVVQIYFFLA